MGLLSEGFSLSTAKVHFVFSSGMVRSAIVNDEQVGRSVDETIRLIKAFQFTDKNGVVCPANWQPGAKTIIPDQEKMKDYFKEL